MRILSFNFGNRDVKSSIRSKEKEERAIQKIVKVRAFSSRQGRLFNRKRNDAILEAFTCKKGVQTSEEKPAGAKNPFADKSIQTAADNFTLYKTVMESRVRELQTKIAELEAMLFEAIKILMKFFLILILFFSSSFGFAADVQNGNFADNEFAEFEVDEAFESLTENQPVGDGNVEKGTNVVEEKLTNNDDEFNYFSNGDEFEEMEKKSEDEDVTRQDGEKKVDIKPLTFADIPAHFRSNWSSYQVEALALLVILIYLINYLVGKSKNHTVAYNWFVTNQKSLEQQFSLVGDDGTTQEPSGGHLIKETDFSYSVWCTGRAGCKGMLTQLKLQKRQDLLASLNNVFRPKLDRVVHRVDLDQGGMDSFVLIFGQQKSVVKVVKEMADLATYSVKRKNTDQFGLPSNFAVFAEIAETIPVFIDAVTLQFLKKYEKYVEYFHFSDQYSGARPQDETAPRLPETSPTLHFSFFLYPDDAQEQNYERVQQDLMNFTFHMIERVRRYYLSKEGKSKAEKKRHSVEEMYLKTTHQQRQEAAQARREEKTRDRKQRLMMETDPEKQRRLEKLEQKREAKQKQPKMKQFKIK